MEARSNSTTSDATSASKFELRITTPTVEVKTPNGGEVLNAGAKYNITYLITGDSNPVNIRLTTNEGASWPHLLTTESWSHNGLCTYEWTVNSLISTECRISVEAKGTNWGYDKSNAKFQIRNIASSTDVWVSPTGSDGTGDGTTSSPFKTVAFALTKVLTGGTIKAYGGTYNEYNITWPNINNLTLKASLETSPVTIDAGGVLEQRCLILNYVLNVTLEGVTLKGGRTNGHGGGIYIGVTQAGANLWLNKVNIRYCSAESGGSYGGAVYCNWGAGNEELVIVRANSCVFENNFAYNSGGVAMSGTWEVSNSIFRNNSSISGGGGVFASIYGYGPWSITNCTFESNFSYSGGVGSNAPLWAKNSLFKNNSASYYAGVYSGIGMTVTNCAFDGNSTSGSVGGGISYFYTNYGPVASYIINCTFYNNSAPNGPGGVVRLDHSDGFGEYVPSWESYNCIYYGNSAQSDAVFAGTPSGSTPFKIRYSDIQSNDFEPGTGNISKEPMFVSASTGDFSLLSTSECINTGTQEGAPTDDIIGTSRPQGAGYDMGAFEYVTQVALPEVPAVATKFFLPSSGAAEVSPGFSAWTDTTGADRIRCVVNKIYSAFATKGTNAGAGAGTYLNRQYVSDPIAPQTISGYVSGEIRGRYSGTVASPSSEITIKIVSNDGQTVRGTLLALTGGNTEYGTSLTSYWIPPCTALTQVTAQNGDRLVFEIGGNRGAGSSTPTITQDFGDSGTTDEVETQTTQGNPWIGFSQSILFPSATIIK